MRCSACGRDFNALPFARVRLAGGLDDRRVHAAFAHVESYRDNANCTLIASSTANISVLESVST